MNQLRGVNHIKTLFRQLCAKKQLKDGINYFLWKVETFPMNINKNVQFKWINQFFFPKILHFQKSHYLRNRLNVHCGRWWKKMRLAVFDPLVWSPEKIHKNINKNIHVKIMIKKSDSPDSWFSFVHVAVWLIHAHCLKSTLHHLMNSCHGS